MHLRPDTFARQSQSLSISAEVIQSIKLLQYSHDELQEFLRDQVERNPLIDLSAADEAKPTADAQAASPPTSTTQPKPGEQSNPERAATPADPGRGAHTVGASGGAAPASTDGRWRSLEDYCASGTSLRDHLTTQIAMSARGAEDYLVAAEIIESLDADGYLRRELEDIAKTLGADSARVNRVLRIVQTLDPAGVGARDLSECLRLQLDQRGELTPAMDTLLANLDLLATYDIIELSRRCKVEASEVLRLAQVIRRCDPRPGSQFNQEPTLLAVPDVQVDFPADGKFTVELNNAMLPRVLIDRQYYAEVMAGPRGKQDTRFITDCMRQAKWLARKVDQRARTILKVATEIVVQQRDFFRYGAEHLKPLRIKEVADAVEMHESTVCRATANKFMMTPRGMFELKFFFVNSIASNDGGDDFSAESIRHKVKHLVAQETIDSVLADDAIVDALRRDGVKIARRTVAKYREMLNIPSSTQRRRQKKAEAMAAHG